MQRTTWGFWYADSGAQWNREEEWPRRRVPCNLDASRPSVRMRQITVLYCSKCFSNSRVLATCWSIPTEPPTDFQASSFEWICVNFVEESCSIYMIILYRLSSSSIKVFFEEFCSLLVSLSHVSAPTHVSGEFLIWWSPGPKIILSIIAQWVTSICPSESSSLDPIPTSLLKHVAGPLVNTLINLANLSFVNGIFPSYLKSARITALLGKIHLWAPKNWKITARYPTYVFYQIFLNDAYCAAFFLMRRTILMLYSFNLRSARINRPRRLS